jgi:hypothetical protein
MLQLVISPSHVRGCACRHVHARAKASCVRMSVDSAPGIPRVRRWHGCHDILRVGRGYARGRGR